MLNIGLSTARKQPRLMVRPSQYKHLILNDENRPLVASVMRRFQDELQVLHEKIEARNAKLPQNRRSKTFDPERMISSVSI